MILNEINIQDHYGTADSQYTALEPRRRSLEHLWKQSSELTLPYVFPEEGISESAELPTPYNSLGPAGVNSLASKLILTLLPPTGNFFRLLPYDEDVEDLSEEELADVDTELSKAEQAILAEIDKRALRVPLFEAMKYLIITGNTLIYKVPNGSIKTFSPYQYVVERDYVGNILKIIIKEQIAFTALPEGVQEICKRDEVEAYHKKGTDTSDDEDIYTVILRTEPDKFVSYQEINERVIPNSYKKHKEKDLPYIPLRWTSNLNEYYGRGLVEQYLGDLRRLEALSQLIVEGAAVQAKIVFGLRPGSTLKVDDLNNAYNGDVIMGDLEREVTTWSVNKGGDFQVPMQVMQQIEGRLSSAFLMMAGNIRDSERTTATEVRAVAAELEATLGGTYSILAADLQIPLVTLVLNDISKQLGDLTEPSIVTGTSAISREKDFNNLNTMMQAIGALGPEVLSTYLDIPGYLRSLSTSLGFDASVMVKSDERLKAEQQAQQQQEAMQQGGMPPQLPMQG